MENIRDKLNKLARTLGTRPVEGNVVDYQTLRAEHESKANSDIAALQQKTRQDRITDLHGRSDLNEQWRFDTLVEDSQDVVEAVSIARSFIAAHADPSWRKSGAHMMIFYGDYGRGKSHIAGAIAHELIDQYETTVLYRQLSSLLELRYFSHDFQSQDKIAEQFRTMTKELLDVDLLILDEVCVNETILKKNAQSWLGNLLRQRQAEHKNCILITNHSLSGLETAMGRYCFESLKEYDTYKVQFTGPSRRGSLSTEGMDPAPITTGYRPNQVK